MIYTALGLLANGITRPTLDAPVVSCIPLHWVDLLMAAHLRGGDPWTGFDLKRVLDSAPAMIQQRRSWGNIDPRCQRLFLNVTESPHFPIVDSLACRTTLEELCRAITVGTIDGGAGTGLPAGVYHPGMTAAHTAILGPHIRQIATDCYPQCKVTESPGPNGEGDWVWFTRFALDRIVPLADTGKDLFTFVTPQYFQTRAPGVAAQLCPPKVLEMQVELSRRFGSVTLYGEAASQAEADAWARAVEPVIRAGGTAASLEGA